MQRPTEHTHSNRHATRTLTFFLTLASALTAGSVHAQTGILVQDAVQEKTSSASYLFQKITQYAKQVQQYETQVQQYQQMLTKVMNLGTNFSIAPNTMQEIDAGPLIQATCNGGSSSIVSNLLNQVTSLMNQSITQSQQAICAQIVTTQVDKYNITVDMMNQLHSNIPALQKLTSLTNGFTTAGESSSATAQAAGVANEMATAMNNWKTQVDADDAFISSLQGMQSTLGHAAMQGNPSLLGNAVQATALTAAFSYQPSL
ncbi:hypothetical protein [Rhodanobacter hydrolyticus]|uniref:Type IV secretion system protein n=1 Tax=Rhodanobacter hydrolyticus TaxID=2250595 RepID=A0ABW8J5Q9_9GAMM